MKLVLVYFNQTYAILTESGLGIELLIRAYTYQDAVARLNFLGLSANLLHSSQDSNYLVFLENSQIANPSAFDAKLWETPTHTPAVLQALNLCSFIIPSTNAWEVKQETQFDFSIKY